ncbi:hypothetical protein EDB89DRAFT_1912678 [Lactarius sanguifluus]|nr:hypothetical protein EDB89DRAFT_1912678 [Lactarius sanguifluus]
MAESYVFRPAFGRILAISGLRARPQSPRPAQDGRPKPGRDWDEKWVLGGLMAQSSLLAFGSHSPTSEASIVGDARPGLRIPWENATYDRCSPFAFKIGSTPDPSEPHPHPPIFPSRVYSPLRNLIRPFYASGFLLQLVTLMFRCNDSPNWQKNWPLTIPVSLSSHLVAGLLCLPLHAATVICNWLHIVHNFKVMLHVTTLATTPPCSRSLRAAFASNLGVRSQMSSDKVSRTHNLETQALIRVDLSAQQVRDSGLIEQDEIGIVWVICIKKTIGTSRVRRRHQVRKSERRPDRHLDRTTREPDARVQLRNLKPRAQQQFLPPPPQPRVRADRQAAQPRGTHTLANVIATQPGSADLRAVDCGNSYDSHHFQLHRAGAAWAEPDHLWRRLADPYGNDYGGNDNNGNHMRRRGDENRDNGKAATTA